MFGRVISIRVRISSSKSIAQSKKMRSYVTFISSWDKVYNINLNIKGNINLKPKTVKQIPFET